VGGTGFEPVAPTMSRSNRDAQIDIFQILRRTFENRQVRTKTEQNGICRQVSAKSMDVFVPKICLHSVGNRIAMLKVARVCYQHSPPDEP
jgi:hypothetical protein